MMISLLALKLHQCSCTSPRIRLRSSGPPLPHCSTEPTICWPQLHTHHSDEGDTSPLPDCSRPLEYHNRTGCYFSHLLEKGPVCLCPKFSLHGRESKWVKERSSICFAAPISPWTAAKLIEMITMVRCYVS